jgi:hypothetical protein
MTGRSGDVTLPGGHKARAMPGPNRYSGSLA